MNKNSVRPAFLALIAFLAVSGWGPRALAQGSGTAAAPGPIGGIAEDLLKLLPRSTILVVVLDVRKLMSIDPVVKALLDPKVKQGYDEFINSTGIDPMKDITYVGLGAPPSKDASRLFMPGGKSGPKSFSAVIDLKCDPARVRALLKEKDPGVKEEMYNGVSVFSNLDDEGTADPPHVLAEMGRMSFQVAFLDASHIVFGTDQGVKDVIDVYKKQAEPLANDPDMAGLLGQVDKSGVAWAVARLPAELIKQASESNPQLKALEGFKGAVGTFDDKDSTFVADIRYLGGTREQNTTFAENLNGLKFLAAMSPDQEPALAELLNGVVIASGEDYTRATLTVSHETIGKLWRLAESKGPGWEASAKAAEELYRRKDFKGATEVGKEALEKAEKALGPDHLDVAAVLDRLAVAYSTQGQFAEAELLIKRSLAIREKAQGPDHPDVAMTLGILALGYCADRPTEAEAIFKRSLAIIEKALGPDDPKADLFLGSLAELYQDQRRYAEAGPLLKRLLAIREKSLGPDHPDVAETLHGLAELSLIQGRFAEAEALDKRALAIVEKAVGPDHPDVAARLNDLAGLYRAQGRHAAAEPLLKRSLAIMEKSSGPDDPKVADSLDELGTFYYTWGRFAQAEPLFLRSLAIREKAFGPDHDDVAVSLERLAQLYQATGRTKEAEACEERAARIRAIRREGEP
jgi:tetratricopeptide (TPR) repeat protein